MRDPPDHAAAAVALVRRHKLVRPRDLAAHGIPASTLTRLVRRGTLERVGRGLYALPGHAVTEDHSIAHVCKRVPSGVVCLFSALRLHELTTQGPPEVWIAIPEKARRPRLEYPPVQVVRFSGAALTEGIEKRVIEGVQVRLYSAAKTVADCFKYRNKIGRDVAVEALRDYLRRYRGRTRELWTYARICRVARVMEPYLEAMQ